MVCILDCESDLLDVHHKRDTKTPLLMGDPWGPPYAQSSPALRCSEVDSVEAVDKLNLNL